MDEGVIVNGCSVVVVVSHHRLQSYHFHQNHSQAKNISFGRNIRIVVEIFKFLDKTKVYFEQLRSKIDITISFLSFFKC